MADEFFGDDGSINLDFGGVEPKTFEVIPEGRYLLQVDGPPKKKVTSNGNDQLSVMLRVVEPEEFSGRVVWDNWMLLPQNRWYMQMALEALTGEQWRGDNMKLNPKDLPGLMAWAVVTVDTYKGKEKNVISRWILENDDAPVAAGESYNPPF